MESLKNLPLVQDTITPIPESVRVFYVTTLARGSGPNGTYLLQDFFGLAAGIPGNTTLRQALAIIETNLANGVLAGLNTIYSRMRSLLEGTYTDPAKSPGDPDFIVIPSGPGAGNYEEYDDAMDALLTAADVEIGAVKAALGAAVDTSNASWTALARVLSNQQTNLDLASIDYSTMSSSAQLPVTAFITSLDSYGQDTQQGMTAEILERLANQATQAGQALVGAMREGRNNRDMDSTGIGHDNSVPDSPLSPPPQAQLLDGQYTVAQARARVLGTS